MVCATVALWEWFKIPVYAAQQQAISVVYCDLEAMDHGRVGRMALVVFFFSLLACVLARSSCMLYRRVGGRKSWAGISLSRVESLMEESLVYRELWIED